MIRVRFLGTSAGRPTVARNVSGISLDVSAHNQGSQQILFDCGEGTQRQLMRFGVGFSFSTIFITHAHLDHCLGIPGILQTLRLQKREEPLDVYAPAPALRKVQEVARLGSGGLGFRLRVRALEAGRRVRFRKWEVRTFAAEHRVPALGFALVEEARPGRFDVDKARALGVPEGPAFGELHRGRAVQVGDRIVRPEEVVGPSRQGRKVVYSGDSRPTRAIAEAALRANLLIHEATFAEERRERAQWTGHSTAADAARVALAARVDKLVITHLSARYSESFRELRRQARAIFPRSEVAYDGMEATLD